MNSFYRTPDRRWFMRWFDGHRTHHLHVVVHGDLYLCRVVESVPANELFVQPAHPFTAALLASTPIADPILGPIVPDTQGEIRSRRRPPSGCRFHRRLACLRHFAEAFATGKFESQHGDR